VQMSDDMADLTSRAFVLAFAGITYQLLHDVEQTALYAEKVVAHCQKQAIPYWLAYGLVLRGWVQCMGGDPCGADLMREQIDILCSRRELAGTPWLLSLLAEGLAHTGQLERALATVDEGIALAAQIGDVHNPTYLLQLKGETLATLAHTKPHTAITSLAGAEAALLAAIQAAQHEGNKLTALRAALSLCRLRRDPDLASQSMATLRELALSFEPDLDYHDLRDAQALLANDVAAS
jgi:hypothetical protein